MRELNRGYLVHSYRTPKQFVNRVGLDIGSHTISGIEVTEHDSEIVIRSAGSVPVTEEKSVRSTPKSTATVRAIRKLWSCARFTSKKVVLALPPQHVYTKWLRIEVSDVEEMEQTATVAATRGAPFPATDAITDYRIISSRPNGSHMQYSMMLVSASSSALDTLLDTVESAGLEPVAVDIAAAAALRSFDAQKRAAGPLWSDQPLAHCIIGARDTTIAVVRGDALELTRTVPVGGNDFTQCISEYLNISLHEAEQIKTSPGTVLNPNGTITVVSSQDEVNVPCENVVGRLAREIQRSLRFFSSQFAEGSYLGMIGATTISGGGALLSGIDTCLGMHGIEISGVINPFTGFSITADIEQIQQMSEDAAAYTTALGLAMGGYWCNDNETKFGLVA